MKRQWLLLLFPVALIAILVAVRYFAGSRSADEVTLKEPVVVIQDLKVAGNVPQDVVPKSDVAKQQTLAPEAVAKISTTLEAYIKDNPKAPDIADAYYNLGNVYYQSGHYEKAIEPLQKALLHHPYDADAHYTLGNAYNNLKRYQDAAKEFELLTKIEPKNDSVFYNLANAYLNAKKYSEAANKYKRAISLNPKNSAAHYGLGLAYQRLDKAKEAMAEFQEAVNLDANNAEAHYFLAISKLQSGDRQGALEQQEFLRKIKSAYADDLNKRINP